MNQTGINIRTLWFGGQNRSYIWHENFWWMVWTNSQRFVKTSMATRSKTMSCNRWQKWYMFWLPFPLKMQNVGLVTEEENLKWAQGFYQDPQPARAPPYLVFHSMKTLKSSIDDLNITVTGGLFVKLGIKSESRNMFLIWRHLSHFTQKDVKV